MSAWERLAERRLVTAWVPLRPLTTYKLGGPARWFAEPASAGLLGELACALAEEPLPVLVIGRGSNLIVSDRGFPGLVIRLGNGFTWIDDEQVAAGGAVSLPMLARAAVRKGRLGLEFFVGVPGSVGGAVRMNAGCHGHDTAECLAGATVVDLRDGSLTERAAGDLDLSYRHSNLTDLEVVTAARFYSRPGEQAEGERVMREVSRWRRDNQPGGTLNAGSVFKNPPGNQAGRLIDELGLKGTRVGGARVSEKHANFFVADDHATARDVYDLVGLIRRRVAEASGIWLEPEIRFVGEFEDEP